MLRVPTEPGKHWNFNDGTDDCVLPITWYLLPDQCPSEMLHFDLRPLGQQPFAVLSRRIGPWLLVVAVQTGRMGFMVTTALLDNSTARKLEVTLKIF